MKYKNKIKNIQFICLLVIENKSKKDIKLCVCLCLIYLLGLFHLAFLFTFLEG